ALADGGARAVVARNEFTGFEKLLLEIAPPLDVVALGDVDSGWDVSRALAKGAKAVQLGPTLGAEGVAVFARLEREMLVARGVRQEGWGAMLAARKRLVEFQVAGGAEDRLKEEDLGGGTRRGSSRQMTGPAMK